MANSVVQRSSALLTDLYQLTMLSAYYELGMQQTAVFEFFVRRLPESRNFLVAAGLEQVLEYLETLRFDDDELNWLAACGRFKANLVKRLAEFRFSGDVCAMPEGTVFFADEPVLRVVAPLPQAQLVESRIINILNLQISIASKAARCRVAAGDKRLIDFGMRRAHGAEAAVLGARASYIGGFDATACVESSRRFGIPMSGTLAHSFIQAHDSEAVAFGNFARCHPEHLTLLIDTYDCVKATETVAAMVRDGAPVEGVRIDSGNLAEEARRVRSILDARRCENVQILASGGLDEYSIASILLSGAPVDGFGVGTKLAVSADAPALDCAYKLQEYAHKPRRKKSASKATWPGRRQVHRSYDDHGFIALDLIGCADEVVEGKTLLHPVMQNGRRMAPPRTLQEIRQHAREELKTLPAPFLTLERGPRSPVKISSRLRELAERLDLEQH